MKQFLFLPLLLLALLTSCEENEKVMPPPEIFLESKDGIYDVDRTDTLKIVPKITYDDLKEYWWKYMKTGEIFLTEKDYEFKDSTYGMYDFQFSVTNSTSDDLIEIQVNVYDIAGFEDYEFEKDKTYSTDGPFTIRKYIEFPTIKGEKETDWDGFALSKMTKYPGKESNQKFFCVQSMENNKSEVFGVFKYVANEQLNISFSDNKEGGHNVKSLDINNIYEAYNRIYTNNLFNRDKNEDYWKLIINGHNSSGEIVNSITHWLANYQFEQKSERFVQSDWETVNLEALGPIHSISFKIEASKEITGDNIALSYFCIDNLKIMD